MSVAAPAVAAEQASAPAVRRDHAEAVQRGSARVEKHIAALHARLAVTAAQEPQWAGFAAVMRENARRMETAWIAHQADAPSMNAVADLKAYAALERARVEDVERLVPPFEELYRVFSPEQRVMADKTFREFQRGRHGQGGA